MTPRAAFDAALDAAKAWHASLPAMSEFADWPADIEYAGRPALALPLPRPCPAGYRASAT